MILPFANPLKSFIYFSTISYLLKNFLPKSWKSLGTYGKLLDEKPFPTVPKSVFRHFYFLAASVYTPIAVYEVVSVYIFGNDVSEWFRNLLDSLCGTERRVAVTATHTLVALFLYSCHIYKRFYEISCIVVISKKASVDIFTYVISLFYYMFSLLLLLCEAPMFANEGGEVRLQFSDLNVIDYFAILLFWWAWYEQHVTTVILANLRRDSKGNIVNETYKIPHGSLFEYLSSPHCTTEILVYVALTILLRSSSSWWSIFYLVIINQIASIIASHEWYRQKFPEFPKHRKMLVPWVY